MLRLKKDFFCFFVVKDPDLLYPQHFGILDPDPRDKNWPKAQKRSFLLYKLKSVLISEWFIKFKHKNKRKNPNLDQFFIGGSRICFKMKWNLNTAFLENKNFYIGEKNSFIRNIIYNTTSSIYKNVKRNNVFHNEVENMIFEEKNYFNFTEVFCY